MGWSGYSIFTVTHPCDNLVDFQTSMCSKQFCSGNIVLLFVYLKERNLDTSLSEMKQKVPSTTYFNFLKGSSSDVILYLIMLDQNFRNQTMET